VSCYIRAIYAPLVGLRLSNQELLKTISSWFEGIQADDAEKTALFDFVRLLLIGNRYRYNQVGAEFLLVNGFAEYAAAFSRAIEESTSAIAAEILAQPPHQPFDAVFGVSSESQLLPGNGGAHGSQAPKPDWSDCNADGPWKRWVHRRRSRNSTGTELISRISDCLDRRRGARFDSC
jgi:hypothetical protein